MLRVKDREALQRAELSQLIGFPEILFYIKEDKTLFTSKFYDTYFCALGDGEHYHTNDFLLPALQYIFEPILEDRTAPLEMELNIDDSDESSGLSYELLIVPLKETKTLVVLLNGISYDQDTDNFSAFFKRCEYFPLSVELVALKAGAIHDCSAIVFREYQDIALGKAFDLSLLGVTDVIEGDNPSVSFWKSNISPKTSTVRQAQFKDNRPIDSIIYFRDIRKHLRNIASTRTQASALEFLNDAFFFTNDTGVIFECNQAASMLVGAPRDNLLGQNIYLLWDQLLNKDDTPIIRQKLLAQIEGNRAAHFVKSMRHLGNEISLELSVNKYQSQDFETYVTMIWQANDISYIEDQIQTIKRNSVILNQIREAVFVIGFDDLITDYNRAAVDLCRLPESDILGSKLSEIMSIDDAFFKDGEAIKQMAITQGSWSGKLRYRGDGLEGVIDVILQNYHDESGEHTGFILTAKDITEQERNTDIMRRKAAIVEQTTDPVIVTNNDNMILDWNKAAEKMFGIHRQEVLEQTFSVDNISDTALQLQPFMEDCSTHTTLFNVEVSIADSGYWTAEILLKIPNDHKGRWVDLTVLPLMNDFGVRTGTIHLYRDISERVRQQDELNRREEMLEMRILELEEVQHRLEVQSGELTVLAEDLAEARDEAELANRAKTDFMAVMSHEIRTPVNGVVGMAELLLETPLNTEQNHYCEALRDSATSLVTLINDILDFAKLEVGRLHLEYIPFNLHNVIRNVVELFGAQAHTKGIDLLCSIDHTIPNNVIGDPARIRQIFQNLISNAIKFTHKGAVVINVSFVPINEDTATLEVTVRDTGIGINEEAVPRLFKKFSQADSSMNRRFGGTGLGLSICKELINTMGGDIGVRSAEGKGSTFFFNIELGMLATEFVQLDKPYQNLSDYLDDISFAILAPNAIYASALQKQLEKWGSRAICLSDLEVFDQWLSKQKQGEKIYVLLDDHYANEQERSYLTRMKQAEHSDHVKLFIMLDVRNSLPFNEQEYDYILRKPITSAHLANRIKAAVDNIKILPTNLFPQNSKAAEILDIQLLVVEDNPINQMMAVKMLEKQGFQIDLANNGLEAIEAVQNGDYQLVLMDIQMPGMDGIEATKSIRAMDNPAIANIPIIAMTANAMDGDREKYLASGMNDYIAKPVDRKVLYKKLSQHLKSFDMIENENEDNDEPPMMQHQDTEPHRATLQNLLDEL